MSLPSDAKGTRCAAEANFAPLYDLAPSACVEPLPACRYILPGVGLPLLLIGHLLRTVAAEEGPPFLIPDDVDGLATLLAWFSSPRFSHPLSHWSLLPVCAIIRRYQHGSDCRFNPIVSSAGCLHQRKSTAFLDVRTSHHTGDFFGIPPTVRSITLTGMDILGIENGKIQEIWHIQDPSGMLQQLGAIPTPEEART